MEEARDFLARARTRLIESLGIVWRTFFRVSLKMIIFIAVVVLLVALPFLAQTQSYPVAVVDGNSMLPTLHNGDLVLYANPHGQIRNGSIIVFIQSDTGITRLDTLLKPIVIHRVVGIGREANGMPYYVTKGDNNQALDPFVTDQQNVLGTPVIMVPYMGFPILFFKTAYGMLMVVSMVSLYFFSGVDTRFAAEEAKKRLAALFARHSLNGEISESQFGRLNKALEYGEELPAEEVKDPIALSVISWLKTGGLEYDWTEEIIDCPNCANHSFLVKGRNADILVCPSCEGILGSETMGTQAAHTPSVPQQWTPPASDELETALQTSSDTQASIASVQESPDLLYDKQESLTDKTLDDLTSEISRLLQENLPTGSTGNPPTPEKRPASQITKIRRDDDSRWEYAPGHDS